METVVVERAFPEPLTEEGLRADAAAARGCFAANRVAPHHSYLSLDGSRLVCVFQSPDAESVRRCLRQLGDPMTGRAWTAAVIEPPAPASGAPQAALALVARSWEQPVAFEEVQAREDAGAWCLDVHRVRFRRTYFSPDRRRMLCLYGAPDAESVRLAQSTIGMPFDDVWPVRLVVYR